MSDPYCNIRCTKHTNQWTSNDLLAFNIEIRHQSAAEFFGTATLPPPSIDEELLTVESAKDMVNDNNCALINQLDLAMSVDGSAVNDFSVELFKTLGYVNRDRAVRTHMVVSFWMCRAWTEATTDVCIVDMHTKDAALLVQEKCLREYWKNTDAQLVAQAVAAFQYSNSFPRRSGRNVYDKKIIPGTGSSPTFYKIPVTMELVRCIGHGEYPTATTSVSYHIPQVPRLNRTWEEGMKPLDNRRVIFECFEAFKQFV